jgi:SAM-dependent methyltransferase
MTIFKNAQDAQGHAWYDYFKDKSVTEFIERDDGYLDADVGIANYFSEYKDWSKHIQHAIKLVKGKVLDIGCGVGRHSLYLQNNGYDVLGIDMSPLAIKISKLQGLKKTKLISVNWLSPKIGKFDTVLMLGNNFGLFENPRYGRKLLRKFSEITNDKAIIIAETLNPYNTKEKYHTDYHKQNRLKGKLGGEVKIRVRYQKFITPWFRYWLASKSEIRDFVKGTGWQVKKFIDDRGPMYSVILEKH